MSGGAWRLFVTGGSVCDAATGREPARTALFRLDPAPEGTTNLVSPHAGRSTSVPERLRAHWRPKIAGVPDFLDGKNGFVAPED